MMLCANAVLSKQKAAVFGVTKQVLEASVAYGYELQHWGVTRNNLIFNDVCIFRVGDPVTLKMLNMFIVNQ